MDIWDKEKRSEVMSKVRSKNTKPEIRLRKALFARGFRYRANDKKLPGKPDIVLPKYKTVIFLHGCFWHGHKDCKYAERPKTNAEFWNDKINSNAERDETNVRKLTEAGWNVVIVWGCEIRNKRDVVSLTDSIEANLRAHAPETEKLAVRFYEEIENEVTLVAENLVDSVKTNPRTHAPKTKKLAVKFYEEIENEVTLVAENMVEYKTNKNKRNE